MPSKLGFGNTRKKSSPALYGSAKHYKNPIMKKDTVKTAEQTEKEVINKAKELRQQSIEAGEKGDVLTANILEAGVRKTLNTSQYKAARSEAAGKRYYERYKDDTDKYVPKKK